MITTYDTVRNECELLPINVQVDVDDEKEVKADNYMGKQAPTKRKVRPKHATTLLSIAWRRVVLDEAHNIKVSREYGLR